MQSPSHPIFNHPSNHPIAYRPISNVQEVRMTPRTLGALGLALYLLPAMLSAQGAPQAPGGANMPGPPAPRPQMPPRDGAAPAVPTGTAGIRGRVMAADTNMPIRRAQVRITGTQPGQQPLQQTASTDAQGRYEFA